VQPANGVLFPTATYSPAPAVDRTDSGSLTPFPARESCAPPTRTNFGRMELRAEVIINAPAQTAWAVLGEQFGDIGTWAGPIVRSSVDSQPGPGTVRTCQIARFGPFSAAIIRERLVEFDPEAMSLAYESAEGMPAFRRRRSKLRRARRAGWLRGRQGRRTRRRRRLGAERPDCRGTRRCAASPSRWRGESRRTAQARPQSADATAAEALAALVANRPVHLSGRINRFCPPRDPTSVTARMARSMVERGIATLAQT